MPLINPRQGRKNAKKCLFFESPLHSEFRSREKWGVAERYAEGGQLSLTLVEKDGTGEKRVMDFFDIEGLKQLIDWAEGRMVGEPSSDDDYGG